MRRFFKKDPETTGYLYLGSCGLVTKTRVLEGDKYEKYVGKGLLELTPEEVTDYLKDFTDSDEEKIVEVFATKPTVLLDPALMVFKDIKVDSTVISDGSSENGTNEITDVISFMASDLPSDSPKDETKKKGGRPKKQI